MAALSFLSVLQGYYVAWGVVLGLLTLFELANPRERHPVTARLRGIGYWAVTIAVSLLLAKGLAAGWRQIGGQPLFAVPAMGAWLGSALLQGIAAGIGAALFHDFFFYWYHRAQHRWLWHWHAVHHSVRNLNAVNSYHHISESFFSLLLIQIPLTLLVADTGPTVPIVTFVLWCHIIWIHSPTRITLGPLRALVVDNRFHRIHHSLETRHFDKNFGAFTTLWDRVFGTCHMPRRDEWPAVGLAEIGEPRGFADWLSMPARLRAAERSASGIVAPSSLS